MLGAAAGQSPPVQSCQRGAAEHAPVLYTPAGAADRGYVLEVSPVVCVNNSHSKVLFQSRKPGFEPTSIRSGGRERISDSATHKAASCWAGSLVDSRAVGATHSTCKCRYTMEKCRQNISQHTCMHDDLYHPSTFAWGQSQMRTTPNEKELQSSKSRCKQLLLAATITPNFVVLCCMVPKKWHQTLPHTERRP